MKFNPFRKEPDILKDPIEVHTGDGRLDSIWRSLVPKEEWKDTAQMLVHQTQYTTLLRQIIERLWEKAGEREHKAYGSRNFTLRRANIDGYKKALQDIYRVLPQTRNN